MKTAKRRTAITATATAAIGLGSMWFGLGLANATPSEDSAFINTLEGENVPYSSRKSAISLGHAVCDARERGLSEKKVLGILSDDLGKIMTQQDVVYFYLASVISYCPDMLQTGNST